MFFLYFEAKLTMNINFNLKYPNQERTPVRVIVTHKGKVYRKNTGLVVFSARWRPNKAGTLMYHEEAICRQIRNIKYKLKELLDEWSTEDEILSAIEEAITGNKPTKIQSEEENKVPTFWETFKQWSEEDCPSRRFRGAALRCIENIVGPDWNWNDITVGWYENLMSKMMNAGYSLNYRSTIVSKIRTVMLYGFRLGYHSNEAFRTFKKTFETADTVYLTEDEIERIWHLSLDPKLAKCRDLFILGVYTASRFSDYSRLDLSMIHDGDIHFVQKKTSDSVIVPTSPRVMEVLKRNGGKAPKLSQVKYNLGIKEVCKAAHICNFITITKSRGRRRIQETHPKYELVTGHTARRTGATLLYLRGVPIQQCMLITGHRTEENFMRYIKVTKQENARRLSTNPFFNMPV